MSLGEDVQGNEKVGNETVVIEIYNIKLNDGRTLYLTTNNENVTWNNITYLAFPLNRENTTQQSGLSVNDLQVTFGDKDNLLTKEVVNNYSIVQNATVTIFQQRESIDNQVSLGFRQIFRGRIKSISASYGSISFILVVAFSSPQKPVNDKKFGEFEGMINVFKRLF